MARCSILMQFKAASLLFLSVSTDFLADFNDWNVFWFILFREGEADMGI